MKGPTDPLGHHHHHHQIPNKPKRTVIRIPAKVRSLFAVEGEIQSSPTETTLVSEASLVSMREVTILLGEMTTLAKVHREVNPLYPTPCMWCSLCLSPGLRLVIADLMSMSTTKICATGMDLSGLHTGNDASGKRFSYGTATEREDEAIRKIKSPHTKRKKGRRSGYITDEKEKEEGPTFAFHRWPRSSVALAAVYDEWATEKFPFIAHWLRCEGICKEEAISQLVEHATGNIDCICNTRRVFSDTDCFMQPNHTCLLPVMLSAAAGNKRVRASDIARLSLSASKHHIHIPGGK